MGKLLPPNIEGTIPAFYANTDGTVQITVPFSMNKAVSRNSVTGFSLKIKTVQSSSYLHTWEADSWDVESAMEAVFTVPSSLLTKLRVGQFYKIQLAYINGLTHAETKSLLQDKLNAFYNYKDAYTNSVTQTELRNAYNTYAASDSSFSQIAIGKLIIAIGNSINYNTEDEWYENIISQLDIANKTVGYYSSVGVIKYTTKPVVEITNLEDKIINSHIYQYTGYYSQADGDITEHLYSYRFDVFDANGNLYKTTGDCLHNSNNDTNNYESYDNFLLQEDFDPSDIHSIRYSITTINGVSISSPRYRFMQKISIDPELDAKLTATLDYENGYVSLNLVGNINEKTGAETPVTGAFLISRSSAASNFMEWDEVSRFKLGAQTPSRFLQNDFTIEQGQTYQYSIQQYNDNGLYSNRILSNKIYADFEDAFLFDGSHQLRIKFNPKVSTFKNDLLEAKVDTIGGKHPFIFRNGNVMYKEMSLSGLISYQMDENNLFLSDADLLLETDTNKERTQTTFYQLQYDEEINAYAQQYAIEHYSRTAMTDIVDMYNDSNDEYNVIKNSHYRTTQLTNYNIAAERLFKLAVLGWLNDGKPKLFRSPTEGNYIVRLLNVSLSPNDTLGRMLHTFSCTAYEIADYNYRTLDSYGLVTITSPKYTFMRWETVDLAPISTNGTIMYASGRLNRFPAYTVKFENLLPGSLFYIDGKPFHIGATGTYEVSIGTQMNIISIPDDAKYTGQMTYGYYSESQNSFDTIAEAEVIDYPIRQFIGETSEVLDEIIDIKNSLVKFLYLHAMIRPLRDAYVRTESGNQVYYLDADFTMPLVADPYFMYRIYSFEGRDKRFVKYYDAYNKRSYTDEATGYKPSFEINGETISLAEIHSIDFREPDKITSLKVNNGVSLDCGYQVCTITYMLEQTNAEVVYARQLWETAKNNLDEAIAFQSSDSNNQPADTMNSRIDSLMQQERTAYKNFITVLEEQKTIDDANRGAGDLS